jgi:hypothetical protein
MVALFVLTKAIPSILESINLYAVPSSPAEGLSVARPSLVETPSLASVPAAANDETVADDAPILSEPENVAQPEPEKKSVPRANEGRPATGRPLTAEEEAAVARGIEELDRASGRQSPR